MPSSKPTQSEANCWFCFHRVLWMRMVELYLSPSYMAYRRGNFSENRIYLLVVDPLLYFSELSLMLHKLWILCSAPVQPCWIHGRKWGTVRGFIPNASVFLCHFHFTIDLYSFICYWHYRNLAVDNVFKQYTQINWKIHKSTFYVEMTAETHKILQSLYRD